jgi:hypothetical protein
MFALTVSTLGLAAGSLTAQSTPPRFFVSTTDDVAASAGMDAVDDGDVILVQEGAAPRFVRTAGHWRACVDVSLGDIDALARRPGSTPGAAGSIAFSLLSNVGTFLDGDVLALADGGGAEVVVSEKVFTAGLGVADGSIDIDAMAWDAQGRLHVSLQSDVAGTTIGDLQNGDILRLEADGSLKRVLTEMDIEEKLVLATGSTASVGDVHGLDIVNGEAIVTIQSPSEFDGAVLDCGQSPKLLLTEAGAGLGGAELDALMAVDDADLLPTVRFETDSAPTGATLHVEFEGEPGGGLLVLWSGNAGHVPFFGPGFGAWHVDAAARAFGRERLLWDRLHASVRRGGHRARRLAGLDVPDDGSPVVGAVGAVPGRALLSEPRLLRAPGFPLGLLSRSAGAARRRGGTSAGRRRRRPTADRAGARPWAAPRPDRSNRRRAAP